MGELIDKVKGNVNEAIGKAKQAVAGDGPQRRALEDLAQQDQCDDDRAGFEAVFLIGRAGLREGGQSLEESGIERIAALERMAEESRDAILKAKSDLGHAETDQAIIRAANELRRENKDGASGDDTRVQFSAKFDF